MEINPILNSIKDLSDRTQSIRVDFHGGQHSQSDVSKSRRL